MDDIQLAVGQFCLKGRATEVKYDGPATLSLSLSPSVNFTLWLTLVTELCQQIRAWAEMPFDH